MGEQPMRVQLRRTKGWRMPPNTVSVARPGRWGNPFVVGRDGDAAECVRQFEAELLPLRHGGGLFEFMHAEAHVRAVKAELRGKNLACWCPLDRPCHADVLLEVANAPEAAGG